MTGIGFGFGIKKSTGIGFGFGIVEGGFTPGLICNTPILCCWGISTTQILYGMMHVAAGMLRKVNICDCIRDEGLFQHVTLPTRARISTRSNIQDLVMTNKRGMVDSIFHESPLGKSDHSVLVIKFIC